MPTSLYNFQYVPLTGRLPGKSFVSQTEQAINGLAQYVYDNSTNYEAVKAIAQKAEEDSSSALEYSEEALDKAQTALETVGRAYIKTTSAVDLNDYFDSELLLILSTASTNLPASISGYLTVMSSDTHDYCMQVYIGIDGSVYKRTATISNNTPTFGAWSETPITMSSLQTILADYAKVNASNIGVNAQSDNSVAWGNAIGGGEIANGEQRLITGGTVYPLSQNVAQNTSNIATNTADIVQNAGGISANSKRISNIEKLLQGNLYDYDTDDDTAYTKSVPAGALPYAGLEKLGGKTVVWNQYGKIPTNSSAAGITWTNDNGVLHFTGTAMAVAVFILTQNEMPVTVGQKIAFGNVIENNSTGNPQIQVWIRHDGTETVQGTTQGGYKIFTAGYTGTILMYLICYANDVVDMKIAPFVSNLTLLAGTGNEPATVADFQQMFPASYYAYNAGTLLSAGVTEVESVGKNLADYSGGTSSPSNANYSNETKRKFTIDHYVFGLEFSNYYSVANVSELTVTDNSVSFKASSVGYGFGIPFNCKGGTDYMLSATLGSNCAIIATWYDADGTFLGAQSGSATSPKKYTSPASAKQGVMLLYATANNALVTFSNIQIEEGSTATAYSPTFAEHYPIPTAIRNLEGYGWSAGTAYNYVDFERKVFVKRVGKYSNYVRNMNSPNNAYPGWEYPEVATLVGEGLNAVYANSVVVTAPYVKNGDACNVNTQNGRSMLFFTSSGLTQAEWKSTYPDLLVDVYVELATPQEIDISEYLTDDNLIEVEAGGTLTFPNSNGTDYQIPVPSDETYMIDLQEALS